MQVSKVTPSTNRKTARSASVWSEWPSRSASVRRVKNAKSTTSYWTRSLSTVRASFLWFIGYLLCDIVPLKLSWYCLTSLHLGFNIIRIPLDSILNVCTIFIWQFIALSLSSHFPSHPKQSAISNPGSTYSNFPPAAAANPDYSRPLMGPGPSGPRPPAGTFADRYSLAFQRKFFWNVCFMSFPFMK